MTDRLATPPVADSPDWPIERSTLALGCYTTGMAKTPNKRERIAVGYCRVSTEGQRDEGVSLEAQRAKIAGYTVAMGYTMGAIHVDGGKSGRSRAGRPGLEAALAEVCRTGGVLVVCKLDRLARSTRDAIAISDKINRCGADLASIAENVDTATGMGKFVFRLLASLGELEADVIGERTASVLGHLRHERRVYSKVTPYGYRDEAGKLIPDASEQRTVAMMRKLAGQGIGHRAIASALNEAGSTRRDGTAWRWETVRAILSAKARELDAPRSTKGASKSTATPAAPPTIKRNRRQRSAPSEVLQ